MVALHGFELIARRNISELYTEARLYRHVQTGAELLSLTNDDRNKVFGITFRTPPSDSTGVAHIIEHSVLCGSRKYPVKEPFIELLKGSLQTFLNAMTFPDKTCYPVASQNVTDFYNLVDVYLDAVFYPRLSPFTFQQEGWHHELEKHGSELSYKGIVFNEMKGVYSSPESLLVHYSQQSLFPDITYGLDSGGDPAVIPELTYEQFVAFHRSYYHPSNSRIFFYGDDDPVERLRFMQQYLQDFTARPVDSAVALQPLFDRPRQFCRKYPAGSGDSAAKRSMVTVNFLLAGTTDIMTNMALTVLEQILIGMPASPLRKALIDSGLGDGITGVGLESDLQQIFFSIGLKGLAAGDIGKVEPLVLGTLAELARYGIDPASVESGLNTVEFRLRENNSGSLPRGLLLMLRALTVWLHGSDPFSMLAFEDPLNRLKRTLQADPVFFQGLLEQHFLDNFHRTTVVLIPDQGMAEEQARAERARLDTARTSLSAQALQDLAEGTDRLKQLQQTPDSPEALATIPRLKLADIERQNTLIPLAAHEHAGTTVLSHDLFTSGIYYCDIGLNLHCLPQHYLPYVPLLGRALLETGTDSCDFVRLSQRIGQKTGGIRCSLFTSAIRDNQKGATWLILRGKAMLPHVPDLFAILRDVLISARLDNRIRLKQILLEEKAHQEQKLIPHGHQVVSCRLRAHFSEADWADEQMHGISYLLFLRELEKRFETDWPQIKAALEEMRDVLVSRPAMIVNVTVDEDDRSGLEPCLLEFLDRLPAKPGNPVDWQPDQLPSNEGLTAPTLVNYVAKGANLFDLGYHYTGAVHVITHFLRTTWLWDKIRVQGGAYGAGCRLDRHSGCLTFVSYRDPNLRKTLDLFDETAHYLSHLDLHAEELNRSIIGAIAEIDTYMLPDAQGYVSLQRRLNGSTDGLRQQMREEILATSSGDFRSFAAVLHEFNSRGIVKVLASEETIRQANSASNSFLKVTSVL